MKPTPTHHLIHWLNNHPNPHETLPGTPIRFADAHDHLTLSLDSIEEELGGLKAEVDELSEQRDEADKKLDRIVFRAKQEIDRMINEDTTLEDIRESLEHLLTYVEDNE